MSQALPIHRSIISILDLCISLSDTWTTVNGDTTFDTSRRSSHLPRRRRFSKKQIARRRKQARGFATSESSGSESSDESEEGEEEEDTTFGPSTSFVSLADEGFERRVERMDEEVDGLVGFVRRGVTGLAQSTPSPEVREVYSLLAFRLNE